MFISSQALLVFKILFSYKHEIYNKISKIIKIHRQKNKTTFISLVMSIKYIYILSKGSSTKD